MDSYRSRFTQRTINRNGRQNKYTASIIVVVIVCPQKHRKYLKQIKRIQDFRSEQFPIRFYHNFDYILSVQLHPANVKLKVKAKMDLKFKREKFELSHDHSQCIPFVHGNAAFIWINQLVCC